MPGAESLPPAPAVRFWRESLVVAVVAVLGALGVFQVWRQPFSFPFNYGGDGSYYMMLVEGLKRHGSFLVNPDLGFPFRQVMYDVPEGGDVLHLTVLRVLVLFFSAPVAVNLFQLATYATISASAHVVLRRLGVQRWIAVAAALLYTFLPFHLQRRNSHLFLSAYAMVPIIVLIALAIMSDRQPFSKADPRSRWWVGAACLGLASTGTYYAVFALLIFLIAGGFTSLAGRQWASIRAAAICAVLIVGMTVVNLSPSLWYWVRHGTNPRVIRRSPQETEVLGLRLQQMLLPRWDHRNPTLSSIGLRSLRGPFLAEGMQSLGIIAATGFLFLLGLTLLGVVRRSGVGPAASSSPASVRVQSVRRMGFLVVVCFLLGTGSGFGYFVSALGLRQVRAYNRISVVIAFCALAALALVATSFHERLVELRGAQPANRLLTVGLAVVLLVGWYDQTSPRDATRMSSGHDTWIVDGWFFDQMAAALPVGSAVLELPYVSFPESPGVAQISAYEPAAGYLHQPGLKWSFGAVIGRAPEPPPDLMAKSGAEIVAYARDLGFRAILVDRNGFVDPADAAEFEARLAEAGVVRAGESAELRHAWFDLGAPDGS